MHINNHLLPTGWKLTRNSFIDPEQSLGNQTDLLSEDMVQAKIQTSKGDLFLVDIGWYGESFSTNGIFKIYVVKNYDWESPLFVYSSKNPKSILMLFYQTANLISALNS